MIRLLKAESLKYKGTSIKKMIFLVPLAAAVMAFFLMGNEFSEPLALNIWYTLFLPFFIGYVASVFLAKERKHLYHGLFNVVEDKKKIWFGKNLYAVWVVMLSNLVMALIGVAFNLFLGGNVEAKEVLLGMGVLTLVTMWQVPFFMLISRKLNFIVTTFICVVLNLAGGIGFAAKLWWMPFATPTRLMCPLLRIYPNAMLIEDGSSLLDKSVVVPGVGICLGMFIAVLLVTSVMFKREESN